MDFKEFLHANHLKQVDIAKYLGVTEASISRICKGISNPSAENLAKLLNNPYEWDTSPLLENHSINVNTKASGNSSAEVTINSNCAPADPTSTPSSEKGIEDLMIRLAQKEKELEMVTAERDRYWQMIQQLMK